MNYEPTKKIITNFINTCSKLPLFSKNKTKQYPKINIKKVIILIFCLLIVGVFCFIEKRKPLQNQERPNLILISIDSLGADHLSLYGYSRQTTPNIDKFAKEAIVFKNHISQSYITPTSEMSLHTGMYPSSSGFMGFDTVLPKNILTLAEILKIYDYNTATFSNSPEFRETTLNKSFKRGFDVYEFEPSIKLDDIRSQFMSQKNIFDFLKKDKEKPFFLWLPIGSAHFPYGKFQRVFGNLNYNGPLKNMTLSWHANGILPWTYDNIYYQYNNEKINNKINLNEEDIQYVIDKYDDDILATDEWIGDFLKQLKNKGLDKNTIIIIQSEHGEEFNEHGYIMHYDILDSTIKTPLIIKTPTLDKKGIEIENQTQGIDILPTILDFLKIPKSHQIEGSSLVPLIKGENQKMNDYIFIERAPLPERIMFKGFDPNNAVPSNLFAVTGKKQSYFYDKSTIEFIQSKEFLNEGDLAVRTNDWKLIYRKNKSFQENYSWWKVLSGSNQKIADYELYDLKSDPQEKENVIKKYPQVADDLKNKLNEFLQKMENRNKELKTEKPLQGYF